MLTRCYLQILLVTHGAFLHFLTEDWTGDDPARGTLSLLTQNFRKKTDCILIVPGTAYLNCEVREFEFTQSSNEQDAHVIETEKSKTKRGPGHTEDDAVVLEEMKAVKH